MIYLVQLIVMALDPIIFLIVLILNLTRKPPIRILLEKKKIESEMTISGSDFWDLKKITITK